jgi:hypothetical protein
MKSVASRFDPSEVPRRSIGGILLLAFALIMLPIAAAHLVRVFSEKDPDFQHAREIILSDAKVLSAFGGIESVRFRARVSHDLGSGIRRIVIRTVVDGQNEDGTVCVTFLRDSKDETLESGISDMRVDDW